MIDGLVGNVATLYSKEKGPKEPQRLLQEELPENV